MTYILHIEWTRQNHHAVTYEGFTLEQAQLRLTQTVLDAIKETKAHGGEQIRFTIKQEIKEVEKRKTVR